MTDRTVVVVGAGPTGATAAHQLARAGWRVHVVERSQHVGGHTRSEQIRGVPFEPNGAHIFHTSNQQVWSLVTRMVEMLPYRHRVLTEVKPDVLMSWPIQLEELGQLDEWPRIEAELAERPLVPDATNFETWCLSLMGETLFDLFIRHYTVKQWGREPAELSSSIAPKRVELRDDGYRDLFRDPYQGWPAHGYALLSERLLDDVYDVTFGVHATAEWLRSEVAEDVPVILTCALDDFFGQVYGPLEWRGVHLRSKWLPGVDLAQEAMVVNRPSADVAWTRTIETKHVLLADASQARWPKAGTVVSFELPGADAKHYPVPDAAGVNAERQQRYEMRAALEGRLYPAGRLATYRYINMDEAMLSGLEVAEAVIRDASKR